MIDYTVTFARSARKELESLHAQVVQRVLPRIEALARAPRPRGCRKLKGETNLWRLRVGDYRVVYAIYDAERRVDIVAIRHRSEAYR